MSKICDNKSVGEIFYKGRDLLMIERWNYPQSFALPAGHLDGYSFEEAAKKESLEEVGLTILKNDLVWSGRVDNPCRREGGSYHDWEVYRAKSWSGMPRAGDDAKNYFWASPERLSRLARHTEYFMKKYNTDFHHVGNLIVKIFGDPAAKNTDHEWVDEMGLEPVWYFILRELGIINQS